MKEFFKKIKNWFSVKKVIILILIIAVLGGVLYWILKPEAVENTAIQMESTVSYGDVVETIEQSGQVEPYERREITALVKGEVISSPFNKGDYVEEGDLLYQIDDEDARLNYEKSEIGLSQSQSKLNQTNRDINKLNIYAPASGTLTSTLKVGNAVKAGEVGKVENKESLVVKIPFTAADYNKVSLGDSATVTNADHMISLNGTVTYKYDSGVGTESDGSYIKNIEITIENPGSLTAGTTVAGTVRTHSGGSVSSAKDGVIENGSEMSLRAEVDGTVKSVYAQSGDNVKAGQLIAVLESQNLMDEKESASQSVKSNSLSVQSGKKSLDDYKITAPISGTIIEKEVEVGDKIDNSNAQTILMVVADMSKMKFTITIDELDISDVYMGQTANVTADALPGQQFAGYVSNIAEEGDVSGQGVTTFAVEITIDEPGELRSGMNVNANIIVSEVKNVLVIPQDALNMAKDGKATVYLKGENTKENAVFPNDYKAVEIEYGVSNGMLAEVKSGLKEGDTVVYVQTASGDDDFMKMMQSMGGGSHGNMGGGSPGNMGGHGGGGERPSGMQ